MVEYLVETHQFNRNHAYFKEMDELCFKSKNIYNSGLYLARKHLFEHGTFPSWINVNNLMVTKRDKNYYALNTKVSKGTLRALGSVLRSFVALKGKKNKGEYPRPVRLPRFLDSKSGRYPVHFVKDAVSTKRRPGFLNPTGTNIYLKTKVDIDSLAYVKIVPRKGFFQVLVGYKSEAKPKEKEDNGRYAAVDLGMTNLMTVGSNVANPFILNGRTIKGILQYSNKKTAWLQSKLPSGQYSSHRIRSTYRKRNNKLADYLSKAVSVVMSYLEENRINTLIVGYNPGWKQNISIGKRNNQVFSAFPYDLLIRKLSFACQERGIRFIKQEESYTSKCSFLDNEPVEKRESYLGKRTQRGLFRSGQGQYINADLNGALNILKKHLKEVWNDRLWSDCIEVSRTPVLPRITPRLA